MVIWIWLLSGICWWQQIIARQNSCCSHWTICPTSANDIWMILWRCKMHETVPCVFPLVSDKSSEHSRLDRNDSKYVPDGLESLHDERANASLLSPHWKYKKRSMKTCSSFHHAVIVLYITYEYTVYASLLHGIACCFTLHCVNWLLPPAGSNVNTLRKSCHASFLERLSVPGHLACIP